MFTLSKFPLYRQYDAMQCGVACLRMVCAHFGRQFSMEELSELCPTTSEGVSMLGISRAAEELGLHTACGRLTVDVLATAPLPCILHWNQNHFVVLHRISGRKDVSGIFFSCNNFDNDYQMNRFNNNDAC